MGGGTATEPQAEPGQDAVQAGLLNYLQTGIGGGVGGLRPKDPAVPDQVIGQETIDPNNPNGSPAGRAGQAAKIAGAAQKAYECGSIIASILGALI